MRANYNMSGATPEISEISMFFIVNYQICVNFTVNFQIFGICDNFFSENFIICGTIDLHFPENFKVFDSYKKIIFRRKF